MKIARFLVCSLLLLLAYVIAVPSHSYAASTGSVQVTVQVMPPEKEAPKFNLSTLAAFSTILLSANQATFSSQHNLVRYNL